MGAIKEHYHEKIEANMRVVWRIGDVAKMIKKPTSTIRFWEGKFKWLNVPHSSSGQRRYHQKDVDKVLLVNKLTGLGMTIAGVRNAYEQGYAVKLTEIMEGLN